MPTQHQPQPQKNALPPQPAKAPAAAPLGSVPAPAAPAVSAKPRPPVASKPRKTFKAWKAGRDKTKADAAQAKRDAFNAPINEAVKLFMGLDAKKQRAVLARAEAKRADEVAWSRSLDTKVSPILTVAGFSIGGLITLLLTLNNKDGSFLTDKPIPAVLLGLALIPLFYAAIKSVFMISPTLDLSEPTVRLVTWLTSGGKTPVVKPLPKEDGGGHLFFGHTARYAAAGEFMQDAVAHFADDGEVLRDTLIQGYVNARINKDKCDDIREASQGILAAILLVIAAVGVFAVQYYIQN